MAHIEKPSDVLLCSTLHDPRGVFLDVLKNANEIVQQHYFGWVVNVTTTTDLRIKQSLHGMAENGVYATETKQQIVEDKVENDHLNLLTYTIDIAKNLDLRKIQYTDGDRIITAATYFPRDLHNMAQRATELTQNSHSYLNFRRSPKDFLSHHLPLVQTEFEINRLYSDVFEMPFDIGSTSHVMSYDVLDEIVKRSPQMDLVSFPHPKWLLIAKEMGARIQSEETKNVLTFETPDQFKQEVSERLGITYPPESYEELQKAYMKTLGKDSTRSVQEWRLRFNTQRQYLTLLKNHLPLFSFSEERKNNLTNEINRTLVAMEIKQGSIIETLDN